MGIGQKTNKCPLLIKLVKCNGDVILSLYHYELLYKAIEAEGDGGFVQKSFKDLYFVSSKY